MAIANRLKTDPIPIVRQSRGFKLRSVTTLQPGKFTPIAAFPLLRQDSCTGRVTIGLDMAETYEVLMNKMFLRVSAYFIPKLSEERFMGSPHIFERSYAGQPKDDTPGAPVVPYINRKAFPATAGSHIVYKYLGLTAKAGQLVATDYEEGYNKTVNFRRRQRSKALPMRTMDDSTLAPAMWGPNAFSDVVPDFDDGLIAGELPLTVVAAKMPLRGIGYSNATPVPGNSQAVNIRETGKTAPTAYPGGERIFQHGSVAGAGIAALEVKSGANGYPDMWAELSENGISVSLANIDQAKKLVSFAKMREAYEGHPDAYVIDALMNGFDIEGLDMVEPWLLDSKIVTIDQMLRRAMDGASLEDTAANGVASTSLGINVPANNYGGVVMIFAEAIPEQLYERQPDPLFTATGVADLPNYMADVLNPLPVVEVKKGEVDVAHSDPTALFGYARRNWKYAQYPSRVGGDLYAPTPSAATTEARRIIYPTDVVDPGLTQEFYESTTLSRSPFVNQTKDPMVIAVGGDIGVTGLTIIGAVHESEANYEELRSKTPPLQPIK